MRKEHRPLWLIKWQRKINERYINRHIRPQFDFLGKEPMIVEPKSLQLFGHKLRAGDHLHLISTKHKPINLHCWQSKQNQGQITLGNYCLISPGVTIGSAENIRIGNNCMIAGEVYISDCDWHGIYNRTRPFRCSAAIKIEDNVWVGFRSLINKGVEIGKNSIVGAGSVVTENVPANTIVAGNPARPVKTLKPNKRMLTREYLFTQGTDYSQNQTALEHYLTHKNTLAYWLKTRVVPNSNN